MPAGERLPEDIPREQKHNLKLWHKVAIVAAFGLLMGNLSAIIDHSLHPDIPYLDDEHMVAGGITALITALLLGFLFIYYRRLETALEKQVRYQEDLVKSEKKYRDLFENSKDVIFIEDAHGRFSDVNPAALQLFGYDSTDELLAVDIAHDLFADFEDWVAHEDEMEKKGYVENYEVELLRKGGEHIFVLETAVAMRDERGAIESYRGTMRDVTRQKKLEAQLNQAQRMEGIGRLAGGLAHDFNNYLTTISGQAEIARSHLPDEDPLQMNLREISYSAEKASSLTRQMLLFSQNQPLNLKPRNLNEVIGELYDEIALELGLDIAIDIDLDDDLKPVEVDAGGMARVLFNLAQHARKNLPDGGRFVIATKKVSLGQDYALTHREAYPGEFACINVRDEGFGLEEEASEHIFEPFIEGVEGLHGMALAVAYGIVRQHQGWIEISSKPGKSLDFRIYLPASKREALPTETGAGGDDMRGHGERILLVEDEEAVRSTIRRMLSENGYTVFPAADAEQAFDIFVNEAGSFNLVFSDVVLPGESGVELVEHLRMHKNALPVILSSGYTDKPSDLQKIHERDYRFLQKPFSLPDLLRTVKEIIGSVPS